MKEYWDREGHISKRKDILGELRHDGTGLHVEYPGFLVALDLPLEAKETLYFLDYPRDRWLKATPKNGFPPRSPNPDKILGIIVEDNDWESIKFNGSLQGIVVTFQRPLEFGARTLYVRVERFVDISIAQMNDPNLKLAQSDFETLEIMQCPPAVQIWMPKYTAVPLEKSFLGFDQGWWVA